jgi:archaemetzincin
MKMAILRIGTVDMDLACEVQDGLCRTFPEAECIILGDTMPVPKDEYNERRRQYYSSRVLEKMYGYVPSSEVDCVLGLTEVDLYVPHLNFVFGEAQCPGKLAIISLCRLRPEFYGQPADRKLFVERSVKEAVHEVGHTFGLKHCGNSECIMFFSNNIQMTDTKKLEFCQKCWPMISQVT